MHPMVLVGFGHAAAAPIIAVRLKRTGPTEALRLQRDVVAAPICLVAAVRGRSILASV